MSYELSGRIKVKDETQQVSEKFKKREFVVETSEEVNGNTYTQYVKLQLTQAKCDILDRFNLGDTVKVSFNIRGKQFEKDGKTSYFTTLEAWRIEGQQTPHQVPQPAANIGIADHSFYNPTPSGVDDLPF